MCARSSWAGSGRSATSSSMRPESRRIDSCGPGSRGRWRSSRHCRRLGREPPAGPVSPAVERRFATESSQRSDARLLLDGPVVAVRVLEEEERVPRAAGAVLPAVLVDVLDRADVDATARELGVGSLDVGDAQLEAGCQARAERDRAAGPGRGRLDVPERLAHPIVDVDVEAELLLVEALRAVDVRDRDHRDLERPVHIVPPWVVTDDALWRLTVERQGTGGLIGRPMNLAPGPRSMGMHADPGRCYGRTAMSAIADDTEFTTQTAAFRRELHVHSYRMLGNFEEAEDAVQETYLRAWRGRDSFDGSAALRAWLYKIATNVCLDAIRRSNRRPPGRSLESIGEVPWIGPYPDRLLDEIAPPDEEPDKVVVARESIELAFLAAVQLLPPRQRAVLILREVLDWPARETADLLDMTVVAVNSALQRARATMAANRPHGRAAAPPPTATEAEMAIV